MRENDGNYTDYTNRDIYVYANTKHIQNTPLPRFMLIGAFVVCVFHKGQIPKNNTCKKCLKNDHPTWKCDNTERCDACKLPGLYLLLIYVNSLLTKTALQFWWKKRPTRII